MPRKKGELIGAAAAARRAPSGTLPGAQRAGSRGSAARPRCSLLHGDVAAGLWRWRHPKRPQAAVAAAGDDGVGDGYGLVLLRGGRGIWGQGARGRMCDMCGCVGRWRRPGPGRSHCWWRGAGGAQACRRVRGMSVSLLCPGWRAGWQQRWGRARTRRTQWTHEADRREAAGAVVDKLVARHNQGRVVREAQRGRVAKGRGGGAVLKSAAAHGHLGTVWPGVGGCVTQRCSDAPACRGVLQRGGGGGAVGWGEAQRSAGLGAGQGRGCQRAYTGQTGTKACWAVPSVGAKTRRLSRGGCRPSRSACAASSSHLRERHVTLRGAERQAAVGCRGGEGGRAGQVLGLGRWLCALIACLRSRPPAVWRIGSPRGLPWPVPGTQQLTSCDVFEDRLLHERGALGLLYKERRTGGAGALEAALLDLRGVRGVDGVGVGAAGEGQGPRGLPKGRAAIAGQRPFPRRAALRCLNGAGACGGASCAAMAAPCCATESAAKGPAQHTS